MLTLPKLFQDGCVLQQGSRCRIWGRSDPQEEVRLSFGMPREARYGTAETFTESQYVKEADADGLFVFELQTPPAGGPYLMTVQNLRGEEALVRELYVGEVFVCAGQSNMELPMSRVCECFPEEFRDGGAPDVHEYKVTECRDFCGPLADHVQAEWRACTREHLPEVSAFAYFFGKELAALKKVPIGILNLSFGGSPAEAWMSREGLRGWPEALEQADIYKDDEYCRRLTEREAREEEEWQRGIARQEKESASAPWRPAKLPGFIRDWGPEDFCGCVYLRRTFFVPEDCLQREGLLRFGTLVDSDEIRINGTCVGETDYRYPPRRYPIPAGLLRKGENEILIRLVCRGGEGRSTAGQPMELVWENEALAGEPRAVETEASARELSADPTDRLLRMALAKREGRLLRVPLEGDWEYQLRAFSDPGPEQTFISWMPTGLYHGMAAPCLPYRVRGVLWYQGESNDSRPQTYAAVLQGLIRDWRNNWQQEKLPFIVIQLPNCGVDVAPGDAWPLIREAQSLAEQMEEVAVTVNLDVGEDNDLHPLDKKTVASRAVRAVRALIYGENINRSAPQVRSWEIREDCVRLRFDAPVALRLRPKMQNAPENPRLFELSGDDGIWYPASAYTEENGGGLCVLLRAAGVSRPKYARYAWSRAPGPLLLYGEDELCVSPFRLCLEKGRESERK